MTQKDVTTLMNLATVSIGDPELEAIYRDTARKLVVVHSELDGYTLLLCKDRSAVLGMPGGQKIVADSTYDLAAQVWATQDERAMETFGRMLDLKVAQLKAQEILEKARAS
ncbi:MAG: hypothetical protein EOM24_26840 [Chloroflexia bacterium]|nr:hypothetical protein [Chloroflexia bacterium]